MEGKRDQKDTKIMTPHFSLLSLSSLCLCASVASPASAELDAAAVRALRDAAAPSLLPVEYTYDGEIGRQVLTGLGAVVGDDGLLAVSVNFTPEGLPDAQLTEFKVILPGDAERKLDAVFQGRDERGELAFVKVAADEADEYEWRPLTLAAEPAEVGQSVVGVGLLPKYAGYKPYVTVPTVSATLRGPVPQVLVDGAGLASVGSVVLNEAGEVVGMVHLQEGQTALLNLPKDSMDAVIDPPRMFIPSSFVRATIESPPTPEAPARIADLGIRASSGLTDEVADYYGLKGRPAVQVGDVIADTAAERAGLKSGDVIVTLDGEPIERGDLPNELPDLLDRAVARRAVGSDVTLGVVRERGKPPEDVTVTLAERPRAANLAERFHAEDLGFTAREAVFQDYYERKLDPKQTDGVIVAYVKRDGNAATGGLQPGDLIQQVNQAKVEGVGPFKEQYQAFREQSPEEAVVLEVLRGVNTQIVRIEPPQE